MPRWLSQAGWLYVLGVCGSSHAEAQGLDLGRAITVEGESSECATARSLRERIAKYLSPQARIQGLSIAVRIEGDSAGFRVLRGSSVIAERRFARVPAECAERRDAIAVAVAVAIENAVPPPAAEKRASASAGAQPASESIASGGSASTHATSAPAGSQAPNATTAPSGSQSANAGSATARSEPTPAAASQPLAAGAEPAPDVSPIPSARRCSLRWACPHRARTTRKSA
jgi:hypothetical protein